MGRSLRRAYSIRLGGVTLALSAIGRYGRTLRYLRPIQVYGRLWFQFYRPKPDLSPAPARRKQNGVWEGHACRPPSVIGRDMFLFLNERGVLAEIGWDGPQRNKLWRYNQHYFDDLNAINASARCDRHEALLEDWLQSNAPTTGTGWESYPTSLRIVNWIKWLQGGNRLSPGCVQSLAVQARWLRRRLEVHLLGNHLMANAKAMVFAGLLFKGNEPKEWLKKGLAILERELPEQVLEDGGHFELSPMYHQIALEDVLDLINLCRAYERPYPNEWNGIIRQMLRWLKVMQHPDGGIAFFNDAAMGIAPEPSAIETYAARLDFGHDAPVGDGVTDLVSTGYFRLQQSAAVVYIDAAPVGPDYLPGHAHADTLSCEFSLYGQRVLVNSGVSVYGCGEERQRQRSTAAHNTLVIDGQNSSEVWAGFRVGRRARIIERQAGVESGALWVKSAHNGYRALNGSPIHIRTWRLGQNELEVIDEVEGRGFHRLDVVWRLHPDITLLRVSATEAELRGQAFLVSLICEGCTLNVEPTTWHPRFGTSVNTHQLVLRDANELPRRFITRLTWSPR